MLPSYYGDPLVRQRMFSINKDIILKEVFKYTVHEDTDWIQLTSFTNQRSKIHPLQSTTGMENLRIWSGWMNRICDPIVQAFHYTCVSATAVTAHSLPPMCIRWLAYNTLRTHTRGLTGYDHPVKMSDVRTVKKAFLGKPGMRRKVGRPKLRW